VGEWDPVGGHAVFAMDGANGASVGVGALVAHDSYRLYGQKDGEGLPDFLLEACLFYFSNDDVIAFAEQVGALFSYFSHDAHG
jgi:hypothetical protein